MHEIAFDNRLCFPFRVYRPSQSRLNRQACDPTMQSVPYALGMSGTIVLYAPLILMFDRRPAAPTTAQWGFFSI